MIRRSILLISLLFSNLAIADGKITRIYFSGPDDGSHSNVVQIMIEGGFSTSGCNTQFAAIRKEGREHLISFALAAYATGEPVKVVLNAGDKYNGDRCTIMRISGSYQD